jgi:hypothetical protein
MIVREMLHTLPKGAKTTTVACRCCDMRQMTIAFAWEFFVDGITENGQPAERGMIAMQRKKPSAKTQRLKEINRKSKGSFKNGYQGPK